jgi:uncharacterized membrane protein
VRPDRRASGYAALASSVAGLLVSAYLTVEHYSSSTTLACPERRTINCARVTTSAWSHIVGIPVALLGFLYFVAMVALCAPPAWTVRSLVWPRVWAAVIGAVSVLYLVWVELFRVDAICIWCTAVHVCTIVVLASVLWCTLVPAPVAGD